VSKPTLAVVAQPRPFGYVVGDLLTQRVLLESGRTSVEPAELPVPGRVGVWFDRRASRIEKRADGHRWLAVEYQVVNAPPALATIRLPAWQLKTKSPAPTLQIAEWPISVGPLTQENIPAEDPSAAAVAASATNGSVPGATAASASAANAPAADASAADAPTTNASAGNASAAGGSFAATAPSESTESDLSETLQAVQQGAANLRADRAAPRITTESIRRRVLFWSAALVVTLSAWLGWLLWRNHLTATSQPFARAFLEMRGADDSAPQAWQALHRAFDRTAGRVVRPESLRELFGRAPQLVPLQPRIEQFFTQSSERFYGAGLPSNPVSVRALCNDLRRVEKRYER
jgi:hypothetical protein